MAILFTHLFKHRELLATLCCASLIGLAYLFEDYATLLFILAFAIGGYAKAREGLIDLFVNRKLNVEILMLLAAIGSGIIGYWAEGAILILIFSLSGALESYTLSKSERELNKLVEYQPNEAIKLIGNEELTVPTEELKLGDLVLIKAGERIPTDGRIIKGSSAINEASITGEAVPLDKQFGDLVYAGTLNMTGMLTVEVMKENKDTLFQKIIYLVQTAKSEQSPSQLFIERFEGVYVKAVLIIVGLMLFLPYYLLGWSWEETWYRAMVLLVVASPCALVASISPAILSAISYSAKRGTLIKGGKYLERLAHIKAISFDKTGTLTRGQHEVVDMTVRADIERKDFISMIASIESYSHHPIAQAIVRYAKTQQLELFTPDYVEHITGWGLRAKHHNQEWKIGKKSFFTEQELEQFETQFNNPNHYFDTQHAGHTLVYIADHKGIAGRIALQDSPREQAEQAIRRLKVMGIYTIMLTGDNQETAHAIASSTNIDTYKADCLPDQKLEEIKKLKQDYGTVAMVGDGINDSPALAHADIGIAMGEGTAVALDTADIVLMKNNLQRIPEAIALAQKMNRIIKQNIYFSVSVIILLILANFFQILTLPIGVIGHEGSTILVILNSLRLLYTKSQ